MNLIETSSSSSDSDDNEFDAVRLMENPNPMVKMVMYGKLKKMMRGFLGRKIKPLERNMMRGMFIRRMKDFNEEMQELAKQETMLDRLKGNV